MTEHAAQSVSILGSLDVRPRSPRRLRRRVWLALSVALGGVLAAQLLSFDEVPDQADVPSETGMHQVAQAGVTEVQAPAEPALESPERTAGLDVQPASTQMPEQSTLNAPAVEVAVIRDLSPLAGAAPLAATEAVVTQVEPTTPLSVEAVPVPSGTRPATAKVSRISERPRAEVRAKRSVAARPAPKADDAKSASDADVDIITAIVRSAAR